MTMTPIFDQLVHERFDVLSYAKGAVRDDIDLTSRRELYEAGAR